MNKTIYKYLIYLIITMLGCIGIHVIFADREDLQSITCNQYYLELIQAQALWNTEMLNDKGDVVVAVVDTGVDFSHEDLEDTNWVNFKEIPNDGIDNDKNGYTDDISGYNFVDDSSNIIPDNHATMCAGIIAAKHNNKGINGIASLHNIKIMSLQVVKVDQQGYHSSLEYVIDAIKYAENNGAKICNLSFSVNKDSESLKKVIEESNMLFVVSAGNNNDFQNTNIDINVQYPASYSFNNILVVTGVTNESKFLMGSNYGVDSVDVAAPGEEIMSTGINNSYLKKTGTSFAAPQVSAVAGIIYSFGPDQTAEEVKEIICSTVKKNDSLKNKVRTEGVVNCYLISKLLRKGW